MRFYDYYVRLCAYLPQVGQKKYDINRDYISWIL